MIAYVFTGEEQRDERGRYIVPRDATHVTVHPSVTVISADLFRYHPNIVELICHDGVIKIEKFAFFMCPRLRRVIILGVKIVEKGAFNGCDAVEYVECPKLERIESGAFHGCISLSNIDLPSAKIVEEEAFTYCYAITKAKFGRNLEPFQRASFASCRSLERITIPLKNGLFTDNVIFQGCTNLKWVDLVEREVLHETVAALLLEDWRNDMSAEIDSINQILPNAAAGEYDEEDYDIDDAGEKAIAIREWIARVLRKIIYYKGEHCRLLNETACALQRALPIDIVTNNVVSFLELPSHTFDGEGGEGVDDHTSEDEDGEEDEGDDSQDELADAPFDEGDNEEEDGKDDAGGRKRRKTADDHEETVESSAN